jgi:hypothetical protein
MVKKIYGDKITDAKLIEIKIPVHFPTITDWDDYELIAGQIQLKDAYYNYVKLKMTRDTMYIVCLPNTTKTRLVNANIITAKEISDIPLNKSSHSTAIKKVGALSEYNLQAFQYNYSAFGIFLKQSPEPVSFNITNPFIESPGKPPNFIG